MRKRLRKSSNKEYIFKLQRFRKNDYLYIYNFWLCSERKKAPQL